MMHLRSLTLLLCLASAVALGGRANHDDDDEEEPDSGDAGVHEVEELCAALGIERAPIPSTDPHAHAQAIEELTTRMCRLHATSKKHRTRSMAILKRLQSQEADVAKKVDVLTDDVAKLRSTVGGLETATATQRAASASAEHTLSALTEQLAATQAQVAAFEEQCTHDTEVPRASAPPRAHRQPTMLPQLLQRTCTCTCRVHRHSSTRCRSSSLRPCS